MTASTRHAQAGMTALGFLILAALVGVVGLAVLKVTPMYIKNMRMNTILTDIERRDERSEPDAGRASAMRWSAASPSKTFGSTEDELKITQSKNGFSLRVQYEVARLVRRRYLLGRRLRQTGRDHAVSARGRWAEVQLRYAFKDASLLDLALTHRSAAKANNERLEYLGDSFLNFTIARRLFELRPDDTEGDLSRARAALVKAADAGRNRPALGVDAHLTLGSGELRSGGAQRAAILADAVEALLGAVLLDGGATAAEAVVDFLFAEQLKSLPDAATLKDPKTRLQEWLQGRGLPLPSYVVTAVQGRDHEQTFIVDCEVREKNAHTTGQDRAAAERSRKLPLRCSWC